MAQGPYDDVEEYAGEFEARYWAKPPRVVDPWTDPTPYSYMCGSSGVCSGVRLD